MFIDTPPAIYAPAPKLFVAKAPAIIIRGEPQAAWKHSALEAAVMLQMLLAGGATPHGSAQSAFTWSPSGNDTSDAGLSKRNLCPSMTFTGTVTQVRCTFLASTAGALNANNCAFGKSSGSGVTTATPVELLFGGSSGFSLASSGSAVSDWANIPGLLTSGDTGVAIMDIGTNGNPQIGSGTQWGKSGATYNQASPAGLSSGGAIYAISLIEVRT